MPLRVAIVHRLAVVYHYGGKADVSFPQVFLCDLIPHRQEDALIVILECFFDGGNKSDSREYDFVTLAAVAATFHYWKPFEKAWKRNLEKHGASYLHTSDAVVGNTPYSRDEGWDRNRIDNFLLDCVKIAGKHLARPIVDDDPGRIGIYPCTVTVNLKDYKRAQSEGFDIPHCVDEELATQGLRKCVKYAQRHGPATYLSFVFDQNEPFRGHIIDRQRNSKFVRMFPEIKDVISNTEADMRFVPALQLADLLAYCYSHRFDEGEKFRWEEKMLAHPIDRGIANYESWSNPLTANIELARSMKFPRRAATR